MAESYTAEAKEKNEDLPIQFFFAGNNDVVESLLDFVGISEENMLAIVDIPNGKLFVCESEVVTADAAKQFIADYLSDKLQGRQLR